jgi:signal transduction histidine kinase
MKMQAESALVKYLLANQNNAVWIAAVDSANQSAAIQISTGQPVVALGGFSVVFYQTSTKEFNHRPRDINGPISPLADNPSFQAYLDEREAAARQSLMLDLVILNIIALIVGSLLSYLLARRTLQPIEDNMEAQAQFVSDASHELRTPLTALRASNEVALRNKKLKLADARQVIADNIDDIARLQDLANSMLGLLKDDDAAALQQPVRLDAIVSGAVNMVVTQALAKDIAIDDQTSDISILGNEQKLIQLMTIFLDNAIKYSEHKTTIYLTSQSKGKVAYISIRDEGVGMDTETLERVFTRFYRADQSRTTTGYGLGLAIAQKIVTAHHGKISVTSTPGQGTDFTIALPLARP